MFAMIFALLFANAHAEQLVINPISQLLPKDLAAIKKSETITLTGSLQIVPMRGAILTIQSTNYGQVILFSPFLVDAATESRLSDLATSKVTVKVSGTMNTVCTVQQLKAETLGCRNFDTSKPISIATL